MSKNIFIVDDDPLIISLLKMTLEEEGFNVISAENAITALVQVKNLDPSTKISLFILDIMMPHKNGYELLKDLKAIPETKDVPVIMLTALDKDEDIMQGYSVGADYYITKPFNHQQLMYGINLLLGA